MTLQDRAERLADVTFTGGPVKDFEAVGRLQLITLLREGLYPASKVVDIGCGCLRGGYWLIHFLDKGAYCGIEPNAQMLEAGIHGILEPTLLEEKCPRFDTNSTFDTSVFGERFDFFLARSVWTHASKRQIAATLDAFCRDSTHTGVFLTSYLRADKFRHRDYRGDQWVGRSHESDTSGLVYHDFHWIEGECRSRKLVVGELETDVFNNQTWLKICRS